MQSMRLTNSGEKRLRTATSAMLCSLPVRSARSGRFARTESRNPGLISRIISRAPRLLVRNTRLFSKLTDGVVAQPQNALVEHAQQQARHGGRGLFDFVEQHQRQVALFAGDGVQLLLGEHGLGFAMAQVAGRRADQLGHLMLHLELAAIHLEDVLFGAVQHFGQRFHGLGLAGAGGSQQQEDADRPAFGRQAGLEHLDIGNDDPGGGGLSDHLLRQNGGQIFGGIRRRLPGRRSWVFLRLAPPRPLP